MGDIPTLANELELVTDSKLGEGAFGAIVEGRLRSVAVAVKLLPLGPTAELSKSGVLDFVMQEAGLQFTAGRRNPSRIAAVHGVKLLKTPERKAVLLMAMEKLDGDLDGLIASRPHMGATTRCSLLLQVAEAVTFLHEGMLPRRIIHGDLKLKNTLYTTKNGAVECRLTDFGLAKMWIEATLRGTVGLSPCGGTLQYMAPEIRSTTTLTDATDVFAFAIVAWELLSGRQAYAAEYAAETAGGAREAFPAWLERRVRAGLRPPLSALPGGTPGAVRAMVARCWSERPQDRGTMAEARDVLAGAVSSRVSVADLGAEVDEPTMESILRGAVLRARETTRSHSGGGAGAGDPGGIAPDAPAPASSALPALPASGYAPGALTIDLCICMDVTSSMREWLARCVAQINEIYARCAEAFPTRIAFVGYRDFTEGASPEEITRERAAYPVMPFTADSTMMTSSLADVKAVGGGKIPEDVAGGLGIVLRQNWSAKVRVLVHIADAPAHGHQYQDPKYDDEAPGGDPLGVTLEALMSQLTAKKIAYFFLKVREKPTDPAAGDAAIGAGKHPTDHMVAMMKARYDRLTTISFKMRSEDLGVDASKLKETLLNSINVSLSSTGSAGRVASGGGSSCGGGSGSGGGGSGSGSGGGSGNRSGGHDGMRPSAPPITTKL